MKSHFSGNSGPILRIDKSTGTVQSQEEIVMSNALGSKFNQAQIVGTALFALLLVSPLAVAQEQVANPAKAPKGEETHQLKELWRVGGYDDEDVLFGVITDIIAGRDGNFYMLDSQLNEVQVYSPGGEYLRTIGREGEGPGEFRLAFNLLLMPNGNIGVLQAFPSKIIALTPDGNPADDFELPKGENEVGFKVLFAARNAGDQLAVVYGFNQPSESGFIQRSILSLFGPNGENERQLFSQDSVMNAADPKITETEWDTFRNRWTSGPDGQVYSGVNFGEYKINVWGSDGKLRQVINREYPVHKRSSEQSERILEIYKGFTRQIPIPNIKYEVEPNWNPIQSINAREDGTLWIQTSHGAWDVPEGEIGRYDVFGRDGKLERQVVLKGQGNPQKDGYFFVKDRLFVVTDWLDAMMALQGGAGSAEESDEEAAPMEIICYQLP
jgi:hypothetical protein